MSIRSQKIILVLASAGLLIAGVVFFALAMTISPVAEDPDVALLNSIGLENQYRECAGSTAVTCYSWQYISGTFSNGVLVVGEESLPLSGNYNESLMLEEVDRDLSISYFVSQDTDAISGYYKTDRETFVSGLENGCVEGAFFYFDKAADNFDSINLPVDDGHKGFLELYPCSDDPQQEQFFSYTRLQQELLSL